MINSVIKRSNYIFKHTIRSCRGMSTRSSSRTSEDYLKTWLGNDMSGETYHSRIMAASKARFEASLSLGEAKTETKESVESLYGANITLMAISASSWKPDQMVNEIADSILSSMKHVSDRYCVLDLHNLEAGEESLLHKVLTLLQKSKTDENVNLVGIINYSGKEKSLCDLPVFAMKSRVYDSFSQTIEASPLQVEEEQRKQRQSVSTTPGPGPHVARAQVHYGTVRSGQQIYAENASLIIIGGVNDGGEVLADGDIHVYGPLKGRAVAGLGGVDGANACVFARSFCPSLVGVNEVFIAPDDHSALAPFIEKEVVVRASGAKNFSTGVGAGLQSVEIDGVTVSLLPLSL